ncbi:MAG TPA: PqqD family protein [Candidatus Angelobacter sp.]|nr:PqqD family protein [Candidatus Angelobacter sp.]
MLLDPRRGKLYPLNPVAALIWRQLGDGFASEHIAADVATPLQHSAGIRDYRRIHFSSLGSGRGGGFLSTTSAARCFSAQMVADIEQQELVPLKEIV